MPNFHLSRRVFGVAVAATVMLAALTAPASAQGFKWWQQERYQRELALTPEQVSRLEDIYQAAGPAMRSAKGAVDKLQADLSAMVTDGRADDGAATDLITRVEAARADLGRARALMLYRMRRILTSDQYAKLNVLFAEHERSRHSPKSKGR